jgi:hypothetical protein
VVLRTVSQSAGQFLYIVPANLVATASLVHIRKSSLGSEIRLRLETLFSACRRKEWLAD